MRTSQISYKSSFLKYIRELRKQRSLNVLSPSQEKKGQQLLSFLAKWQEEQESTISRNKKKTGKFLSKFNGYMDGKDKNSREPEPQSKSAPPANSFPSILTKNTVRVH